MNSVVSLQPSVEGSKARQQIGKAADLQILRKTSYGNTHMLIAVVTRQYIVQQATF